MGKETAIIILNWNQKKMSKVCLDSVFKQTYKNFKVFFIDNNSRDESINFVKRYYPNITFIKNKKNIGYASGNNVGIKRALKEKFKYIFILNNDVILKKDSLGILIDVINKNNTIGVVGPHSYDYQSSLKNTTKCSLYGDMNFKIGLPTALKNIDNRKTYEIDSMIGCALLVKSQVFKKAGLFDKDYYMYWEEYDFLQRVKSAKFKIIFVPFSKIYHRHGFSSKNTSFPKEYYFLRNQLLFIKKNSPLFEKIIFYIYFIIKSPFFLLRKKNIKDIRLNILAILDFLTDKKGETQIKKRVYF